MKSDIPNYTVFVCCGLIPWTFFSTAISRTSFVMVENGNIIKKVYFPREILPISVVTSGAVNFVISTIIILAFVIFSGVGLSWYILLYPFILLIQYVLLLGIGFIVSSVTVYFRDLEHIIGVILMAAFYGTPIVYKLEQLPDLITDKLKDYLKKYFVIGGMPRAVKTWIEEKDFELVERVQKGILEAYERDFSKYTDNSTATKIQYVWNSIPSQLAKENRKFIYGVVKDGARAREYENSINWLKDTGLIRVVNKVKCGNKQPLKAYEDLKAFKIYLLDVGLLRVLCELPYEF